MNQQEAAVAMTAVGMAIIEMTAAPITITTESERPVSSRVVVMVMVAVAVAVLPLANSAVVIIINTINAATRSSSSNNLSHLQPTTNRPCVRQRNKSILLLQFTQTRPRVQRDMNTLRSFCLQHGITEEDIRRVLAGQQALGSYNFEAQNGR
ncbi:hypothetical protein DPV78_002158 [Talaromyces pinophilus]|nr:hypothetical protein DPV78_002158 [Talaromyces pinophilus]